MIFDASNLCISPPFHHNLETLLSIISSKKLLLPNSMLLKFPCPILFELESLKNLTPSYINNSSLIVLNEEIYNLSDHFAAWLVSLVEKSEYFKKIEKNLKIYYCFIVEGFVNFAYVQPNNKKLGCHSKQFYLRNFLNFFEIFLNELRKSAFAFGYYEDPKVLSGEKVKTYIIN